MLAPSSQQYILTLGSGWGCSNMPVATTILIRKGPRTLAVQVGTLRLGRATVPKVTETQYKA